MDHQRRPVRLKVVSVAVISLTQNVPAGVVCAATKVEVHGM